MERDGVCSWVKARRELYHSEGDSCGYESEGGVDYIEEFSPVSRLAVEDLVSSLLLVDGEMELYHDAGEDDDACLLKPDTSHVYVNSSEHDIRIRAWRDQDSAWMIC